MNWRSLLAAVRCLVSKPCPVGQHVRQTNEDARCMHCGMSRKQAVQQKHNSSGAMGKPVMPTVAFVKHQTDKIELCNRLHCRPEQCPPSESAYMQLSATKRAKMREDYDRPAKGCH